MKKLLFVLLFICSANTYARECVLTWNASLSADVTHYTLYNGDEPLIENIAELTTTFICAPGIYALTATNKYGIESDTKSESIEIKKPVSPDGLGVVIK